MWWGGITLHQHILRRKARFDRVDVEIANQRRKETFSLGAIRVKTGADTSTDRCGICTTVAPRVDKCALCKRKKDEENFSGWHTETHSATQVRLLQLYNFSLPPHEVSRFRAERKTYERQVQRRVWGRISSRPGGQTHTATRNTHEPKTRRRIELFIVESVPAVTSVCPLDVRLDRSNWLKLYYVK